MGDTHVQFELPIHCQIMIMIALRRRSIWTPVVHLILFAHWTCGPLCNPHQSPMTPHPWPCPLPLGVSAPLPADLFQNVSFSPRLCCLFYRSLSLCCERLRLLVMEVNLTNLWISPISLAHFLPSFLHILFSFSVLRFLSCSPCSVTEPFYFLLIYKNNVY